MGPTRIRELLLGGAVTAILGFFFVSVAYGSLPPIPLLGGVSLLVLAIAEGGWAFYIRNKVTDGEIGVGTGRLPALVVARSVVVAKASAWLGTLMTGWWLAMLVYILPRRAQLAAAAADTFGVVIATGCALALVVAGLWLQHCCKSPPDPPATPAR
ncbi:MULTISPECIES: DUF3180 domain-containing protein [Mycobacteroides]|uniref:DUF3180 domain-containing protein n=2 Tax=Mycobacteroides TaxID=670516 RepID=A0AB73LXM6_MYCCH|nr:MULTISPECIES: DUF3180 domain-containing protein [Mycobacteroides]KRQ21189.1 hypothetical protein AOT86_21715 [Mycobacteroides sp. H072]KRQ39058.1 hypothetical protein AOT84_06775 [Mycobacteroides sp. H002]KRQ54333.1 hypothetical protein AOT85_04285 [Mycobacteroides sp. H054]OHT49366.1 hypothetical protein BKG62_17275 [Mycobacteroides chelonae]OHT59857.1 hypothetical protein BKG64_13525 [Mycobacteroides chelonae]